MAKRKLIEAAIPLDAINAACKADKDRKTGTLRNLHKWFAPMPLPAWRALLFCALVDDPEDELERDELLRLVERLVASGGEVPGGAVIAEAKRWIAKSWPNGVPPVMDPFAGGGSTLVEAQRLGCATIGSDVNPVPVLITKVLTELLPQVAHTAALHAVSEQLPVEGGPYEGIAADVLHYAGEVQDAARHELQPLYRDELPGQAFAWIWCRTVECGNPACRKEAPLLSTTWLNKRRNEERAVNIRSVNGKPAFEVVNGPPALVETVKRQGAVCIHCHRGIPFAHIRAEGVEGRLRQRLVVRIAADGGERLFQTVSPDYEARVLAIPEADLGPDVPLQGKARQNVALYGLGAVDDLFTSRQQQAIRAYARHAGTIHARVLADGGSRERADVIAAILALCVGKLAQANSTQTRWKIDSRSGRGKVEAAFGDHSLPMTWDFAEANPIEDVAGSWPQSVRTALRALEFVADGRGVTRLADARSSADHASAPVVVATDPPYFNQIAYADLSDFFYVWLKLVLRKVFPDLFATIAVPKDAELVASPSRHGQDDGEARRYFIDGFTDTFHSLQRIQAPDAPILVIYAFKEQASNALAGEIAPGWEAILEALIGSGLKIVGTWPIRGTGSTRKIAVGSNALATYVVLVCRPREATAPRITRSELVRLLRTELASAVARLQRANIAPVDLAQAVIGPGMQVYSRHSSVVETDGSPVGVAEALGLINRTLGEILDEQEGDLDPDSRWAVLWYEQHGFDPATFGEADQLARAKGIAVDSLVRAGIVESGGSKVSLVQREVLHPEWDPAADARATAWEAVQYLVRALNEGGEQEGARLYARLGPLRDPARELAYRLFQIAEKAGRTDEAIVYNGVVTSWPEIARLADSLPAGPLGQTTTEALF